MKLQKIRGLTVFSKLKLFIVVLVVSTVAPQVPNVYLARADDGGYPWANAADVYPENYGWGYSTCPTDAPSCMTKK